MRKGLHIGSAAPGDDVSVRVRPGESYNYSYEITDDTVGGLHYYHAHAHGSTTIQVGAGAAGLLVVDDDDLNSPQGLASDEDGYGDGDGDVLDDINIDGDGGV